MGYMRRILHVPHYIYFLFLVIIVLIKNIITFRYLDNQSYFFALDTLQISRNMLVLFISIFSIGIIYLSSFCTNIFLNIYTKAALPFERNINEKKILIYNVYNLVFFLINISLIIYTLIFSLYPTVSLINTINLMGYITISVIIYFIIFQEDSKPLFSLCFSVLIFLINAYSILNSILLGGKL